MKVVLIFLSLLLTFTPKVAVASNPLKLLFCYEDKALPPYFLGAGSVVPNEKPGASIEIIRHIDSSINAVKINYIRKPWKRCLDDLASNKVDAIIGSYSEERALFAKYPMINNKIDQSKAMSNHATCFIKHKVSNFSWDGTYIKSTEKPVIAVPAGYSIINTINKLPVIIHEALSAEQAIYLLEKKRVDAAVSLCRLDNRKQINLATLNLELEIMFPPINVKRGYLIFSINYYQQNTSLVEKIWQFLTTFDSDKIYQEYVES
ncbi:substrate-binding periplasmic protein [Pseudoalteromonas denitrificans]|uniref:Polar amino acid transport system substrate-binding protein n=1 Tax=Pseudoalteromonas denitrificans DSM 6059 TaxID=1123010 RepID=A0A1I1FFU5_9GAMM|nr:transporter substrate-binding domain-containing protein [Pseudoalteromonas denitrificans]SFB98235.1 polar amino acid transport system substrate-binding protein [Pseudoalteromonas denitrificans DSM 6059]